MAYLLGEPITLTADLTDANLTPEDAASLAWLVRDPLGIESNLAGAVTHPSVGVYKLVVQGDTAGVWYWRLVTAGNVAVAEGNFTVADEYAVIADPTAPTDLHVMVPRARRYCEGPYGPPTGKPSLQDSQLYEMVADACGDIILFTGNLFGHKLVVTQRDTRAGFPTGWATDVVLEEWECALITTQVALNYFFYLLRDMRTSVAIKNEGTEFSYTLSANVLGAWVKELQSRRDLALKGLRDHHPVLDRYASNIRVRDQATVALLEWWSTNQFDRQGGGLPGGQESAVVPWTPGWSGPGFTMGY